MAIGTHLLPADCTPMRTSALFVPWPVNKPPRLETTTTTALAPWTRHRGGEKYAPKGIRIGAAAVAVDLVHGVARGPGHLPEPDAGVLRAVVVDADAAFVPVLGSLRARLDEDGVFRGREQFRDEAGQVRLVERFEIRVRRVVALVRAFVLLAPAQRAGAGGRAEPVVQGRREDATAREPGGVQQEEGGLQGEDDAGG